MLHLHGATELLLWLGEAACGLELLLVVCVTCCKRGWNRVSPSWTAVVGEAWLGTLDQLRSLSNVYTCQNTRQRVLESLNLLFFSVHLLTVPFLQAARFTEATVHDEDCLLQNLIILVYFLHSSCQRLVAWWWWWVLGVWDGGARARFHLRLRIGVPTSIILITELCHVSLEELGGVLHVCGFAVYTR